MEPRDDLVPMMMHMMMEMWLVKLGDVTAALGGEAVAIRSGLKKNNFPASRLVRYLKAGIESRNFVDFLHIITPCFDFSQFVRPMSILTKSYASFDS